AVFGSGFARNSYEFPIADVECLDKHRHRLGHLTFRIVPEHQVCPADILFCTHIAFRPFIGRPELLYFILWPGAAVERYGIQIKGNASVDWLHDTLVKQLGYRYCYLFGSSPVIYIDGVDISAAALQKHGRSDLRMMAQHFTRNAGIIRAYRDVFFARVV